MIVLASTGTLTRTPDFTDHRRILDHGARIAADGLELVVYEAWYERIADVTRALASSGLTFPVVHADKRIGAGLSGDEARASLDRFTANAALARELGARTLVLHLWELPDGDRFLHRNLVHLPALLDIADAHGAVLAVETVPASAGSPLANVRRAHERHERCRVTLDTEFLAVHGELEQSLAADWLWEEERVAHVHVKDSDGSWPRARYLAPGEGRLDLERFLGGVARRGFAATVTLEAPAIGAEGQVEQARLERALALVRSLVQPS